MKRAEVSVTNAIVAIITNLITIFIGFFSQKIFSVTLGKEYLGINGLFNNIISMLAIVELGIGSAIIYHLYKPIAKNEYAKIRALMNFYKNAYRIICLVICTIGICIIPFLNFVVGEVTINESIYIIFSLFLADTIASYLLTYKRSILYANQKNYIINIVHIVYLIIMTALQTIILFTTKNYLLYLVIKIICRIMENVILTLIVNKQYSYLKEKSGKLDKEIKQDIIKKIKALFLHKIGDFVVKGTDNIIIAKFLGVIAVGLYSGYSLIISALNLLIQQIYDSITASIGNLLVENNKEKSLDIYEKLEFINFWLASLMSISFYCIVTPFVKVWLGESYLLPNAVVIAISINFYFQATRKNINAFKTASGIFYEDRFMPILESAVNIFFSIILVKLIGFSGVFIGTIISNLVLHLYGYPKYVYNAVFNRARIEYIKKCIFNFIIAICTASITIILVNIVSQNIFNNYIQIVVNAIICCAIPNLIFIILFNKNKEFKFFINIIISIYKKITKAEIDITN